MGMMWKVVLARRAVDSFDGRGAGEDDAEVERSDGDGVCAGVSGRRAGVEVDVAAVYGR